jgi:hypothetical protein
VMTRVADGARCTRAWRCQSCRALLGVVRGAELHVKYKEAHYWIDGRCRHACRRCGAINTLEALPKDAEPTLCRKGEGT